MSFFITQDGAQIHYEVIEGVLPQDTMFIHGNMASNRWWYPSAEIWKQKSAEEDNGAMILVEFRGCGKSSAPRGQSEVDMSLFANDFISLAKSLGRGKINVVGHSAGGLIAGLMMAKAPDIFAKGVLLDPVGAKGIVFQNTMTAAFENMKTNKELVALVIGSTIQDNNPHDVYFRDVVVEDAFHAANTVGDLVLRALDGFDCQAELSAKKHSVLVLHGEFDTLLPIADSRKLAQLMQGEFAVIPGQGHCVNIENPQKFVDIANTYLFI